MAQGICETGVEYSDSQARRISRKAGLRCIKARGKQHINQQGGYQLLDETANIVLAGRDFDLSTDQVVEIARNEMNKDTGRG